MQIFIYNPNSKGGNYKYAQYTTNALAEKGAHVTLILPKNSQPNNLTTYSPNDLQTYRPILLSDQPNTTNTLLKKLYFFYRIFFNPIIFYRFLKKQPASKIIFNDFDQLTAIFWGPLFKKLKKKHKFSIVLHDPDRDAYPGGIKHTKRSMKAIMNVMDVAFFHEQLPEKIYYQNFPGYKQTIPHGIYPPAKLDEKLFEEINQFKQDSQLLVIPGNIRYEKNYQLIIKTLQNIPECKLLIAGAPSSSSVHIDELKKLSYEYKVDGRIFWLCRYLSESEFTSILEVSDLILLYYQQSFTSQSGILNQIAPLKKNVLISDTSSALTKLAKEFNLGTIAKADSAEFFVKGVKSAIIDKSYKQYWDNYLKYASWDKQAEEIIRSIGE
nr:glycosyltransferase [uncultured Carboxylicivirga sp.]